MNYDDLNPRFKRYCALIGIDPVGHAEWVERVNATPGWRRVGLYFGLPRAVGTGVRHYPTKLAARLANRQPIRSPSAKKRAARAQRKAAALAIARAHGQVKAFGHGGAP